MNIHDQIASYLAAQPVAKGRDLQALHSMMLGLLPGGKLWFLDGRDETGKIVSNPSIGYGIQTLRYADGSARSFYQIGISANTAGITIYLMGLDDRNFLSQTFGDRIGKASVTGYCIKFRKLAEVDVEVLREAILYGISKTSE